MTGRGTGLRYITHPLTGRVGFKLLAMLVNELQDLALGCLLSEIGKTRLPTLLLKKPQLSSEPG